MIDDANEPLKVVDVLDEVRVDSDDHHHGHRDDEHPVEEGDVHKEKQELSVDVPRESMST